MDPVDRPSSLQLLKHDYFRKDNFSERFAQELKTKITKETADNPLLKLLSGSKHDEAEEKAKRKEKKMKKLQETREAKEREARRNEIREAKKHKETKETTSTEKVGKKQPLPSTNQSSSSSSQAQENVSPTHASSLASTSSLHATTSSHSTPGTPLETINIANSHGRQLSPIQSASAARHSPSRHSPTDTHSTQNVNAHPATSVSSVLSTKNSGSHTLTLSKTNISLSVVGTPSHESPTLGPPAFRVTGDNTRSKKQTVGYNKKLTGSSQHQSHYLNSDMNHDTRTFSNYDLSGRHSDIGSWQDSRPTLESSSKKKREKEVFRDRLRSENELPHLPDLHGIEGKSYKGSKTSKKTSISMMPHITNLTPFQNGPGGHYQGSSPSSHHQGNSSSSHDSNLPSV